LASKCPDLRECRVMHGFPILSHRRTHGEFRKTVHNPTHRLLRATECGLRPGSYRTSPGLRRGVGSRGGSHPPPAGRELGLRVLRRLPLEGRAA